MCARRRGGVRPRAPSACPDAPFGAARRSGRDGSAATNAATDGIAEPRCRARRRRRSRQAITRPPPRSFASARTASRTSACWDAPFGAVSDADLPSWFVVDAASAIATASGARRRGPPESSSPVLSSNVSTKNATHPSPRPYPSALASNVLHLPSGDSAPSAARTSSSRREAIRSPLRRVRPPRRRAMRVGRASRRGTMNTPCRSPRTRLEI